MTLVGVCAVAWLLKIASEVFYVIVAKGRHEAVHNGGILCVISKGAQRGDEVIVRHASDRRHHGCHALSLSPMACHAVSGDAFDRWCFILSDGGT